MKRFALLALAAAGLLILSLPALAMCPPTCQEDEILHFTPTEFSAFINKVKAQAAKYNRGAACECPQPPFPTCKAGFNNVGTQICEDGECRQVSGTPILTPGSVIEANFRDCVANGTSDICKSWVACTNCRPAK